MSTTSALIEGHYIATESTHRPNGVIVHQAGCECGAQFEWNDRDKAHARHLLDVVRAEERERIARMTTLPEQARAEAEKRVYPAYPLTDVNETANLRSEFEQGFLAGHEAATRTREVTTVAELDALRVGSVVRSLGGGAAWQRLPVNGFWVGVIGNLDSRGMAERGYLPARVLYEPED